MSFIEVLAVTYFRNENTPSDQASNTSVCQFEPENPHTHKACFSAG